MKAFQKRCRYFYQGGEEDSNFRGFQPREWAHDSSERRQIQAIGAKYYKISSSTYMMLKTSSSYLIESSRTN